MTNANNFFTMPLLITKPTSYTRTIGDIYINGSWYKIELADRVQCTRSFEGDAFTIQTDCAKSDLVINIEDLQGCKHQSRLTSEQVDMIWEQCKGFFENPSAHWLWQHCAYDGMTWNEAVRLAAAYGRCAIKNDFFEVWERYNNYNKNPKNKQALVSKEAYKKIVYTPKVIRVYYNYHENGKLWRTNIVCEITR